MARCTLAISTERVPGAEETFHQWYDQVHLPEALTVAGLRRGQRFQALPGPRGERPDTRFLAVDGFESDDPAATLQELREAMKTQQIDPSPERSRIVVTCWSALGPVRESAA